MLLYRHLTNPPPPSLFSPPSLSICVTPFQCSWTNRVIFAL
ncbi:uncharacterized protein J3R85_015923 [Psidium guajava]|nr:uncharacterized protein J3R85_015923 [Psidium guajava]